MSARPSLYRRHRPRTFADVVGQEHVVRTLSHAVERNKVHHAYLFVGSRGTGKTSMAKILASCLNCENGPTITPCGVCDSCTSIASATSMDVIEMDAASNNSVDDIRELRETVAYAPVSGRHKVYILDEAHMLSSQAWNAFLKTLEEPPPNTVFVLATTEAQKVLPTVVDRCHRFDFGRPAADQIAGLLRRVADQESIELEDGAAALVARHATGSYRDALGTLEQLVDYASDGAITAADVMAVLGVADAEQLFGAVEAIIARNPGAALGAAAALSASGRDPGQVLRDLESHARELLTVQVIGEVPPELAITPDRDARLVRQAGDLARTDAVRLLDLVSGALEAAANGAQSRIQLELVLIRAAAPEFDPSVSALLSRIERLEQGSVARAVASAPVAVAPAAPAPAPVAAVSLAVAPLAAAPMPAAPTPAAPTPMPAAPTPAAPTPTPAAPTPTPAAPTPAAPTPAAPAPAPAAPVAAPAAPVAAPDDGDPGPYDPSGDPGPSEFAEPARVRPEPAPEPPTATADAPPAEAHAPGISPEELRPPVPAGSADLVQMQELWPAVIEMIRGQSGLTANLLAGATPVTMSAHELTVELPAGGLFAKRKLDTTEQHHRKMAVDAVRTVTGLSLELTYLIAEPVTAKAEPAAEEDGKLSADELVTRFVEEFDAQELKDQEN